MAKKLRKSEGAKVKLTKAESDVLTCLTKYNLSVAEIAIRRGTTKRAVQLLRKKLERKGLLEPDRGRSFAGGVSRSSEAFEMRLHALQWKVGILRTASWDNLKPRVIPDFMGCYVSVGDGYVEIYAKDSLVFLGSNEWECFGNALQYFENLGKKLEVELRCQLIKPKAQNWELVKHEFATEGSEVAKRHIGDGVPLRVFARDDGKLWFWGDWSKKAPEHETNAKVDSEEVNKHLNDWREFHPPTNSQLFGLISQVLEMQRETAHYQREQAAGLAAVLKVIAPQQGAEPENKPLGRPDYVG